ncbi:hypothetical protein DI09_84p50 [Mitosporidium daphniae]|uniref:Thioredoxin domain-containing protein n=1 Tax=Mitosporidium daphniae TaxID=1485682 RepID=A0A098VQZ1_9MICR|nr:uncharacterized protein DI09_84p50 [Mitosporidium daphniae]KGG50166.1 hypothetical protein DI09_84p50 [Mitosporidium daphniae]|eukprot:XP_013236602.1 uncharacterized protein DI09_84p50 [Mitosporidium daphniae]
MELINSATGSIGNARIGGQPFTLIDKSGQIVNESIFQDRFSLLYFGFTHCPDICPEELDKLTAIVNEMDKHPSTRDLINPVFVSVDPKRDTPEAISEYLKDFHPKMMGLTGTKEQLLKFAKQYRVYFSVNPLTDETKEDYLVDHSVFFYLVGPDGKFLDFFGSDMELSKVISKLNERISQFIYQ